MRRVLIVTFGLSVASVSQARAAIIWAIGVGGNGNAYEQIVTVGDTRDLAASKSAEEALTFIGVQAHLVTITSAEEQL